MSGSSFESLSCTSSFDMLEDLDPLLLQQRRRRCLSPQPLLQGELRDPPTLTTRYIATHDGSGYLRPCTPSVVLMGSVVSTRREEEDEEKKEKNEEECDVAILSPVLRDSAAAAAAAVATSVSSPPLLPSLPPLSQQQQQQRALALIASGTTGVVIGRLPAPSAPEVTFSSSDALTPEPSSWPTQEVSGGGGCSAGGFPSTGSIARYQQGESTSVTLTASSVVQPAPTVPAPVAAQVNREEVSNKIGVKSDINKHSTGKNSTTTTSRSSSSSSSKRYPGVDIATSITGYTRSTESKDSSPASCGEGGGGAGVGKGGGKGEGEKKLDGGGGTTRSGNAGRQQQHRQRTRHRLSVNLLASDDEEEEDEERERSAGLCQKAINVAATTTTATAHGGNPTRGGTGASSALALDTITRHLLLPQQQQQQQQRHLFQLAATTTESESASYSYVNSKSNGNRSSSSNSKSSTLLTSPASCDDGEGKPAKLLCTKAPSHKEKDATPNSVVMSLPSPFLFVTLPLLSTTEALTFFIVLLIPLNIAAIEVALLRGLVSLTGLYGCSLAVLIGSHILVMWVVPVYYGVAVVKMGCDAWMAAEKVVPDLLAVRIYMCHVANAVLKAAQSIQ